MTREPDIAEAAEKAAADAEEGAPQGAPNPSVPAGDPEAPVASVESVSVGADPPGAGGAGASDTHPGNTGAAGASGPHGGSAGASDARNGDAAQDVAAEDHERKLEADLEQLTAKAEKADEYLELAQRTRADFENYRKRAAREAAAAQERGITKLAKELLPAVDNLDRALEAAQTTMAGGADGTTASAEDGTATLMSGIKLVHEDVIAALARAGIERFSPQGERFDPQLHEAVAQVPTEGAESGTVVEVYQRGYRLGEVVIRPARVVVAA